MRFQQFFLLAPALLAAAQQTTNSDESSSVTSSASASDQSATDSSSASSTESSAQSSTTSSEASSGSGGDTTSSSGGDDGSVRTTTFGGGRVTLLTDEGGDVVGTVYGPLEMASTLRENENLGTIMTSVPLTVYTTSATPSNTETDSDGNPTGVFTTTFGGRATLLTDDAGEIVGTVYGPLEMASTLRENENLGTIVTSIPETTYTTSANAAPTGQEQSDNAAPAVTRGPMLAGGVIGVGMAVVGLL